jgi:hypothetical protein
VTFPPRITVSGLGFGSALNLAENLLIIKRFEGFVDAGERLFRTSIFDPRGPRSEQGFA